MEETDSKISNPESSQLIDRYPTVSYPQLFKFATRFEIVVVIVGLIISCANGALYPISMIFFADVVNAFMAPTEELLEQVKRQIVIYAILGAVGLVLGFLQAYLLAWVTDKLVQRIRLMYFRAVLRQDIPWHERNPVGVVISQLSHNIPRIEEGMGGNLANFFRDISLFISGIIVAFTQGWKLTLVAISMIPIIAIVFTSLAVILQVFIKVELRAYAAASTIAAEVLSAARTVIAFGGEKHASERYDRELGTAQRATVMRGLLLGTSIGMISFSIFSTVALIFYYGCVLITQDEYEPGTVVLVVLNMVYGAIAVGKAMPLMEFFLKAAGNARPIFGIIERVPTIDINNKAIIPKRFDGVIEFKDVSFNFPQRPDNQILKHFNLKIKPGEKIAVVGPSGSGKSTLVQLLLRHYDPNDGQVLVDGVDIRDLDLRWLRGQMCVVPQEPVLFSGSIESNIKIGLPDATLDDIIEAAKLANAHDFICRMPEAYDTWLGEGGASISGGQKQRVAIARALIRKPRVLLLDEATSALDTYSEGLVQSALDRVSHGRTVITIAHRLSTIRNADRIIVVDGGEIKETGTHEELLDKKGIYCNMLQQLEKEPRVEPDPLEDEGIYPTARPSLPYIDVTQTPSPTTPNSFKNTTPMRHGKGPIGRLQNLRFGIGQMFGVSGGPKTSVGPSRKISGNIHNLPTPKSAFVTRGQAFFGPEDERDWMPEPSTRFVDHFMKLSVGDIKGHSPARTPALHTPVGNTPRIPQFTDGIDDGASQKLLSGQYGTEPDEDEDLTPEVSSWQAIKRSLLMNKSEWWMLVIAYFASMISGVIEPSFALLFAETFNVFPDVVMYGEISYTVSLLAGMMSFVGFLKLLANFVENSLFGVSGGRVTRRARRQLFEAMLRQEPGWFDRQENQCGFLTARLANEILGIQQVSGKRGGVFIEGISVVILTIGLAFLYSWQLALLNMIFAPALVCVGIFQVRDMGGRDYGAISGTEIVQESVASQRTIASLGLEEHFYKEFEEKRLSMNRQAIKARICVSIINSFAQGIQYFQNAAIYYLGAYLVSEYLLEIPDLFKSVSVVNFGAQGLGRVAAFLPDLNVGLANAVKVFRTFDRKPKLLSTEGLVPKEKTKGEVEFRNVQFAYPTRRKIEVLKGLTFKVAKGENVAFVGESGCGKSTCLQLVQRLYDVDNSKSSGGIFLDGRDLRELQPAWLRRQIGVVSQEPNLFDMTIRENIAYGDLDRTVSMDEVIAAARDANIHDFISSLPDGYDTSIGFRGSQLSGGQKQRIAIARALIRKPTLLILDEATSALDVESERVVQTTLDKAMLDSSRTSLVVAHRLTTVENCTRIGVIQEGRVVESGSAAELKALGGHYCQLQTVQTAQEAEKEKRKK